MGKTRAEQKDRFDGTTLEAADVYAGIRYLTNRLENEALDALWNGGDTAEMNDVFQCLAALVESKHLRLASCKWSCPPGSCSAYC